MSSPSAIFTSRPSSLVSYFLYHQSSRLTTVGIGSKLYSGTGDGMLHSRLRPSHGSASQVRVGVFEAFLALLRLRKMLTANTIIETPMVNAPTVETMFQKF